MISADGVRRLSRWAGLSMATALVAATLLLRLCLYAGDESLLIIFVVPIILSAYLGGLEAGLAATLLAGLASKYFLLPPLHSLMIGKPVHQVQWAALLMIGVALNLLVEGLRRSRRRLEKSRSVLAVTLGSIGDAVIVADNRGRITFINAEAERMTGWTRAEAIGQPLTAVFKIINEQTGRPVESPVDKVLRLGTVAGLANHTVLIAKDGREIPIDDSAAPVRQKGGATLGAVLVFRDFTERRRAEERIKHLASFPELNPSPVMEVDASGEMTFCNPGTLTVLEALGIGKEDCEGFLPEDLGIFFGTGIRRTNRLSIVRRRSRIGSLGRRSTLSPSSAWRAFTPTTSPSAKKRKRPCGKR